MAFPDSEGATRSRDDEPSTRSSAENPSAGPPSTTANVWNEVETPLGLRIRWEKKNSGPLKVARRCFQRLSDLQWHR